MLLLLSITYGLIFYYEINYKYYYSIDYIYLKYNHNNYFEENKLIKSVKLENRLSIEKITYRSTYRMIKWHTTNHNYLFFHTLINLI